MGIIKWFSYSSNDGYQPNLDINLDPYNFKIVKFREVGFNLVAMINYPNCTNYEGNKILVFKDMTNEQLQSLTKLDPHFSKNGLSPFARFEPTEKGFEAAITIAYHI